MFMFAWKFHNSAGVLWNRQIRWRFNFSFLLCFLLLTGESNNVVIEKQLETDIFNLPGDKIKILNEWKSQKCMEVALFCTQRPASARPAAQENE